MKTFKTNVVEIGFQFGWSGQNLSLNLTILCYLLIKKFWKKYILALVAKYLNLCQDICQANVYIVVSLNPRTG